MSHATDISDGRAIVTRRGGEKAWMQHIITFAAWHGWSVYHPFDSRRSEKGWPDLFMCRRHRAVAIECKFGRGRVTPEQQRWLDALELVGVETYVFWPDNETQMRDVLR